MEEKSAEKECTRGTTNFTNGTRLCLLNKCMTCNDGEWTIDELKRSVPTR